MSICNIMTLEWPWCDLDMTLVLSTIKAQLLLMLLFARKLRSHWCLVQIWHYKIFWFFLTHLPRNSAMGLQVCPGVQRYKGYCAIWAIHLIEICLLQFLNNFEYAESYFIKPVLLKAHTQVQKFQSLKLCYIGLYHRTSILSSSTLHLKEICTR